MSWLAVNNENTRLHWSPDEFCSSHPRRSEDVASRLQQQPRSPSKLVRLLHQGCERFTAVQLVAQLPLFRRFWLRKMWLSLLWFVPWVIKSPRLPILRRRPLRFCARRSSPDTCCQLSRSKQCYGAAVPVLSALQLFHDLPPINMQTPRQLLRGIMSLRTCAEINATPSISYFLRGPLRPCQSLLSPGWCPSSTRSPLHNHPAALSAACEAGSWLIRPCHVIRQQGEIEAASHSHIWLRSTC